MLGYEWGSHSPLPPQLILTDDINHDPSSHHHRPIFDGPFSAPCTFPNDNPTPLYNLPHPQFSLYDHDPRAFPCTSSSYPSLHHSMLTLDHESILPGPAGFQLLVPKPEPQNSNRIGLNLGGRTYFAADDDLMTRLYRRSRGAEAVNSPKCQAEGCNADLSHAKHYHRRHKVCEFHSKAATVVAAGLTQRFCQQCSRFHMLSEFDNGKRSCRKRLADHNRRRRKSHQSQTVNLDHQTYPLSETARSSFSQRSPSDSGANSSSSVTVVVSSPLASFDSGFRQRLYQ